MLFNMIHLVFQIYLVMLFVRIVGSWLPEFQQYKIMQFINFYTEPYLNFFRSFIPPLGMFDLSPIAAIFCLGFIERFVLFILGSIIS